MQHKARGQIDDVRAALPMQAEYHAATRAACGQVHAAPLARCGQRRPRQHDIGETGTAQRDRKLIAFLRNVGSGRQILQRAAAAGAEMWAAQIVGQPNADSPVCARPRMSACTSCVPS